MTALAGAGGTAVRAAPVGIAPEVRVTGPDGRPVWAGTQLSEVLARAPAGSTVTVHGVHRGPLVVRVPLRLRCEGAVLDGGGRGTVLTVAAPRVTVEGCVVRGSGTELVFEHSGIFVRAPRARIVRNVVEDVLFGIYLKGAPGSRVEGNVVRGKLLPLSSRGDTIRVFNSPGTLVRGNRVEGGRDFILWFSDHATIQDNLVTGGRYGLHFMYNADDVVRGNRFVGNAIGSYVMYSRDIRLEENVFARSRTTSGFGLAIKESDGIVALRNLFVDNSVGLYLDDSPYSEDAWGDFRGNVVLGNGVGVWLLSNVRHNRFGGNVFSDNVEQVRVVGGALEGNDWAPGGRGNFWSDYVGFDADGDGVGDVPYRAERFFEQLLDAHPEARVLLYSPAVTAVDLAARAFPVFAPRLLVQDPRPLMEPSIPPRFVRRSHPSGTTAGAAGGLLLVGIGVAAVGWRPRRRAT